MADMKVLRLSSRLRTVSALALLVALLLSLQVIPAFAQVSLVVNSLADGSLATLAGNSTCDLREAIEAANIDGTVAQCIHSGTGDETITFTVPGTINAVTTFAINHTVVTHALTINGGNAITIDGGSQSFTLFTIGTNATPDAEVVNFSNIVIQNGGNTNVPLAGCIGYGLSASGTLSGVTVQGCVARNAGGIYVNLGGAITLTGSLIQNNRATGALTNNGGGIFLQTSTATITGGSIIRNNDADNNGGGLFLDDDSVLIVNGFSRIDLNDAGDGGGAIFMDINSRFTGNDIGVYTNTADYGSAFYARGGDDTRSCANCCIVNNSDIAVGQDLTEVSVFRGNWWGHEWGPHIPASPSPGSTGSGSSPGDSIDFNGQSLIDVGFTVFPPTDPNDYGESDGSPTPNSAGGANFLTAPPALGAPAGPCLVCNNVSAIGVRTRVCTSTTWPRP